ncbi:MAG: hypothetical protein K6E60_10215 [Saccharofermentans sp.]|nr:hypothetical protein [Saccharofermentans sp.]
MDITDKYIPREYLALKINYCKKQLAELPEVVLHEHNVDGVLVKRVSSGGHRHNLDSVKGKQLFDEWLKRDALIRELRLYENIWDCYYKGAPPDHYMHKITRTLAVDFDRRVVMDRAFFDSLKEDSNTRHPKNSNYYFNGINYRSAAEREIAIFYTEIGIPFKYEPEITLLGLPYTINPDFVLYIKELDTCKFHEHLGMKHSSDYIRDTKIKYSNYTGAGLIPDIDILFTHDTDNMPFDIRYLYAKLNSAIYGTMFGR